MAGLSRDHVTWSSHVVRSVRGPPGGQLRGEAAGETGHGLLGCHIAHTANVDGYLPLATSIVVEIVVVVVVVVCVSAQGAGRGGGGCTGGGVASCRHQAIPPAGVHASRPGERPRHGGW